jgi:hypothetical protein
LKDVLSPNLQQMIEAFEVAMDTGLKNVKLGNLGRFAKNMEEYDMLHNMGAI